MPPTIVPDASILIPAPIRDTLLRAALAGLCRVCLSEEILEEIRRNLIERRHLAVEAAQRATDRLREFPHKELVEDYESLIPTLSVDDPEDRHVLAVAVRAKADLIITANLRHFPPAALKPYQIRAQSPDEFLCDLFDQYPGRMAQIISEQAAALKNPPLTPDQVLANVARHAPSFAQRVRDYLASR